MFKDDLKSLINQQRESLIVVDFSFCYKSDKNNRFARAMDELGFR